MSCYFRHMKQTLTAAGITITDTNKRSVDQAIHKLVGVPYKSCSPTWRKVKAMLSDDTARAQFSKQLRRTPH